MLDIFINVLAVFDFEKCKQRTFENYFPRNFSISSVLSGEIAWKTNGKLSRETNTDWRSL